MKKRDLPVGVYRFGNRYQARYGVTYLGTYETPEEAAAVRADKVADMAANHKLANRPATRRHIINSVDKLCSEDYMTAYERENYRRRKKIIKLYADNHSTGEIAEILNMKQSVVARTVSFIIQNLREKEKEHGS